MSEINNLNFFGTSYDIVDDSAIHERADWSEADPSSDAYIAHKPENLVQDANYVHTDNNYTTAEKTKLAGLELGRAKVLTSADYNYPTTGTKTAVALWLLEPGVYTAAPGVSVSGDTTAMASLNSGVTAIVGTTDQNTGKVGIVLIPYSPNDPAFPGAARTEMVNKSTGAFSDAGTWLGLKNTVDNLTSNSTWEPLSAKQGKVLKGLIDSNTTAITNETTARQTADTGLQTQIDAIVASSDVKDIVGTKADLNNYDTSTLGDNDIIKVLRDESQNDATTYYRWSTSTSVFTPIGSEGPYYTKAATDTLLNAKADKSTTYTKTETDTLLNAKQNTLTAGNNIQISGDTISATDTTYSDFTGTDGTTAGTAGLVPAPAVGDEGKFLSGNGLWTTVSQYNLPIASANDLGGIKVGTNLSIDSNTGVLSATDTTYSAFTGTDGTTAGTAGLVPAPATTDADKFLKSDGNWTTVPAPTTVQTTGTSTTDIMSQKATTDMIWDPDTTGNRKRVYITGANLTGVYIGPSTATGYRNGIKIGSTSYTQPGAGVVIGQNYSVDNYTRNGVVGYGNNVRMNNDYVVCLGDFSKATEKGQMDISTMATTNTYGYNDSQYRLLTGLYDPQNNHDAATKGYVDSVAAATVSSTDWSNLWQ